MKNYKISRGEFNMYKTYNSRTRRIAKYFRKTWKNKLCAIALLTVTYSVAKLTGEATAFVIMLMFTVPMFFARSNWFTN